MRKGQYEGRFIVSNGPFRARQTTREDPNDPVEDVETDSPPVVAYDAQSKQPVFTHPDDNLVDPRVYRRYPVVRRPSIEYYPPGTLLVEPEDPFLFDSSEEFDQDGYVVLPDPNDYQ